jgi:hypothetical protein
VRRCPVRVEVRGLDRQSSSLRLGHPVGAVHVRVRDLSECGHRLHRFDAADHVDALGTLAVQLGARLDDDTPTTAVIAAMPIAMPSADRKTRSGRLRRPALPFPAGQLVWPVVEPFGEADAGQRHRSPPGPLAGRHPRVQQPVRHVVHSGLSRREVELLEHEPDPPGAQRGQLPGRTVPHVVPVDPHHPGRRAVERADQVQHDGGGLIVTAALPAAGHPASLAHAKSSVSDSRVGRPAG